MKRKMTIRMRLHKTELITGALLIIIGALSAQSSALAQESSSSEFSNITDKSLAQIIRSLIGLPQNVAAAGSRSALHTKSYVCLINPVLKKKGQKNIATTSIANPIIITGSLLNELKIREADGNKKILFQALSSSTEAVKTPLKWPIKPIGPNEKYILEFRNIHSPASEKVEVLLISEEPKQMKATQNLIEEFNSLQTSTFRKKEIFKGSSPEVKMNILFSLNSTNKQHLTNELACRL